MRFEDVDLQTGLQVWRDTADRWERACADNLWFDERVSSARQEVFEDLVKASDAPGDLPDRQTWYWKRFVRDGDPAPHTFAAELEPARLGPGPLEPFQPIVRLEDLRGQLHDQYVSLEQLQAAKDEHQTAVLDKFLEG
jgi:hypothetical protein